MSIESMLKSNNELLERIAVSLEAIVESQGIVAAQLKSVIRKPQQELPLDDDLEEEFEEEELEDDDLSEMEDEDLDDDLGDDELEEEEETPPPARKKRGKKKAKKKAVAKKKTTKKTRVGKRDTKGSRYTADEVRGKLKDLQIATGSAAQAKSILKKNGASTFGQLQVGRYNQVVAAVDALLED